MTVPRLPRWRCAEPRCPQHRWQVVRTLGEYDPIDVALEALEAHHLREHAEKKGDRRA